jgi:predicted MPP superfamily phosphohydrolase
VSRIARIIFPFFWEVLSLTCAIGEWLLACWAWGAPDRLWIHPAALLALFVVNRCAATAFEREDDASPFLHRSGEFLLATGFAAVGGSVGLILAGLAWACVVRAGGLAAQAGTTSLAPLDWLGAEFHIVGWLGAVAGIGLVVDGYLRGHRRLQTTRFKVTLPSLPPGLDGFRIVQVSDLHLGPIADRAALRNALARVAAEDPDLVVVTGDIVDSPKADLGRWLPELAALRARHGVVAILGNHDNAVGLDRVAEALRTVTGWTVLRDAIHPVVTAAGTLHVAGLEFRRSPQDGDAVPALATRLPPGQPALLLAHHPNAFPAARDAGILLTLAGHTHGGQIAVPFAPRWNVARALMTSYDAGTFQENGCVLHVNRGVGTSGQRLRIGAPPEISVVTLRAPRVSRA